MNYRLLKNLLFRQKRLRPVFYHYLLQVIYYILINKKIIYGIKVFDDHGIHRCG